MRPFPVAAVCAFVLAIPARAVDVSGHVLNKRGSPVAGAQVCVKSEPGSCVATDALGAFRLDKPLSLRPGQKAAPGFSLAHSGGRLVVTSPIAAPARLEWLSPQGRKAYAVSDARLGPGANSFALPTGLPHAGVCILRLAVPGLSLAWKAVLAPGASSPGTAAPARIAALSKTAGATLEIRKEGYRTRIYEPIGEQETEVVIVLSETADAGLEFGGEISLKVVSLDREGKRIITESVRGFCDPAEPAKLRHETIRDTLEYAIRDGGMWTWAEGDCYGRRFTGTGADPVGTWSLYDEYAPLPSDLRTGCEADPEGGGEGTFNAYSGEYVFSETQIAASVEGETCPGDFLIYLFGDLFKFDSSIAIEKNTCRQIGYKNGKGETAAADFSKRGDSLHLAFTYKTAACAGDLDFGLTPRDPVCPETSALDPFFDCVTTSGFAIAAPAAGLDLGPTQGVGKASAAPRGKYIFPEWKAAPPRR